MTFRSTLAVGILAALSAPPLVMAQAPTPVASPKIIISNGAGAGSPVEVPVAEGGGATMQFLSNGDLQVSCRLDAGKCPNVGSGGAGAALSFTRTPATAEITSGFSNLTLDWSSAGSQVCFATGPASIANWNGSALLNAGSRVLTAQVTEDATLDFGIRCFTQTGGITESSTSVLVKPGGGSIPPTGDPFCAQYYPTAPSDPAFTAYGQLNRVEKSWVEVFGSQPGEISTSGSGGRIGVPGAFLSPSLGNYLSIPFVMSSDTDPVLRSMKIEWSEASGADGVATDGIVLTVSPCPGDFRTRSGFFSQTDNYVSGVCGGTGTNNSGVTITATGTGGCPAPVGKQMYLNITSYAISSTRTPVASSCITSGGLCGVRMRVGD